MPTSRTFDTTSPGKDFGEMKIFPRSPESERLMLVKAIIQATKLVNRHATKKNANGKTQLEESQEKLASTKRTSKRLGDIRRMGQNIFSPHIMQNNTNTKYSDIFLATYWTEGQSQPLYDSGTPQQSNKNKEKESTQATITEDDETNDSPGKPDQLNESINEELIESYDFDEENSMTRQQSLFTSYEDQQTDALSHIMTQLQEADDVDEPDATSTTKEEALTKESVQDQPKDEYLIWQLEDQDELLRILSARIDALYYKPTITNLETRVTKEQEQRVAMETTLSTIQASITSTEVRKDEQKEYILSLQKHKSLLDNKKRNLQQRTNNSWKKPWKNPKQKSERMNRRNISYLYRNTRVCWTRKRNLQQRTNNSWKKPWKNPKHY
jgi:hypothetical protein